MLLSCLYIALLALCTASVVLAKPEIKPLPSLREQTRILEEWRTKRLARIPSLLEKYNADAWLISHREHAEDTIWRSVKNVTDFDTRRRTILFFHKGTSSLEGQPNPMKWIDNTGAVWPELRATLEAYNPKAIVLNTDGTIVFGGGLHVGELEVLQEELGSKWMDRTLNKPLLGVELAGRQVLGQLEYYRERQETVWAIMAKGFSNEVITPGVTTAEDVEWWFRDTLQANNISLWCHPRISVTLPESFPGWEGSGDVMIQPGDFLHIDWCTSAMGLSTDTQHLAYVLEPGETDAPQGLKDGLRKANRMQDIALQAMKAGDTGNQILTRTLAKMKEEGIEGQIYSHAIGEWGHGAGAAVGFTNLPEYVPVFGEEPVFEDSWYSIELFASHFVPERNETLRFRLEEDAYFDQEIGAWKFVYGRQETYYLIESASKKEEDIPPFVVQENY